MPMRSQPLFKHRIMKLFIVGGTGKTGRKLIEQGLERGHVITALVRNPGKVKISNPNLKIIQGNVLARESFESSLKGQDAVLSALGHKRFIIPTTVSYTHLTLPTIYSV